MSHTNLVSGGPCQCFDCRYVDGSLSKDARDAGYAEGHAVGYQKALDDAVSRLIETGQEALVSMVKALQQVRP